MSVGVGPKEDCSKNRTALAAETVEPVPLMTCAVIGAEVAPPGAGFTTMIGTGPAWEAMAVPEMTSSVEDIYIVVTGCPPKDTVEPSMNPVPVKSNTNAPIPIVLGFTDVIVGTGFCRVTT